jgi:hypothetical protein
LFLLRSLCFFHFFLAVYFVEFRFSLGAIDEHCKLTQPIGATLAEFPVEPRVARMLIAAGELGCSVIIKNDPCDNPACAGGVWIGYNHAETPTTLKVGDKVIGGVTPINKMSDKGSRGAPHLHASAAKSPVPHIATRELLLDLFALIDASRAARQAAKAAAPK